MQFNCFFLMPLLDKYPACLREDLEAVAGGDAEAVFDIARTRRDLEIQERELKEELARVSQPAALGTHTPCRILRCYLPATGSLRIQSPLLNLPLLRLIALYCCLHVSPVLVVSAAPRASGKVCEHPSFPCIVFHNRKGVGDREARCF